MYRLPPRLPVSEVFHGYLLQIEGQYALSTWPDDTATTVLTGDLMVRLAVVYLGRSHQSIVPELIALDTGGGYSGEEAWDFLFNKSNLFPRAEVVGYRDDGTEDMITVKSLDLMYPVRVLVYDTDAARKPIAEAHAVITPDPESLPPRLRLHLPYYATTAAWQKALT